MASDFEPFFSSSSLHCPVTSFSLVDGLGSPYVGTVTLTPGVGMVIDTSTSEILTVYLQASTSGSVIF